MKAATGICRIFLRGWVRISIHAAREGGDEWKNRKYVTAKISIHAAREGGDLKHCVYPLMVLISIHAAREGGDYKRNKK